MLHSSGWIGLVMQILIFRSAIFIGFNNDLINTFSATKLIHFPSLIQLVEFCSLCQLLDFRGVFRCKLWKRKSIYWYYSCQFQYSRFRDLLDLNFKLWLLSSDLQFITTTPTIKLIQLSTVLDVCIGQFLVWVLITCYYLSERHHLELFHLMPIVGFSS